ncbi:hypothetical protein [Novosphingobium sp.]|uniref:hypothetical protein n=1 Tax=Novosphingobium sp. TaxID=1874826 RepID=UPI003D09E009
MGSQYFSLFDMAICAVPALSIGLWQLVSVNREIRRDKQASRELPESAALPESAPLPERSGHPVRQHRLDDR